MEKNRIIEQDKLVVVMWGIRNILDTAFNISIFLIIGITMRMTLETIVFTLGYIPLRSFIGGYHAKTPVRCCILSNIILFTALILVRCVGKHPLLLLALAIVGIIILVVLAPVSDIHKPLDENDRNKYRIKGFVILLCEIIISIVFLILDKHNLTLSVFSTWILLSLMLILGKIKDSKYKKAL
ncbi:MAG: accessory gene regulator B family protein [Ruminococcus sp.]|nr:accessory gene regulator B family protein [Ruminococcus sp.]